MRLMSLPSVQSWVRHSPAAATASGAADARDHGLGGEGVGHHGIDGGSGIRGSLRRMICSVCAVHAAGPLRRLSADKDIMIGCTLCDVIP